MDGDDGEESEKAPVLTLDEVKKWSKALLEVRPFAFLVSLFLCLLFLGEKVNINIGGVPFYSFLASVVKSFEEVVDRVQGGCAYERGGSGVGLDD